MCSTASLSLVRVCLRSASPQGPSPWLGLHSGTARAAPTLAVRSCSYTTCLQYELMWKSFTTSYLANCVSVMASAVKWKSLSDPDLPPASTDTRLIRVLARIGDVSHKDPVVRSERAALRENAETIAVSGRVSLSKWRAFSDRSFCHGFYFSLPMKGQQKRSDACAPRSRCQWK